MSTSDKIHLAIKKSSKKNDIKNNLVESIYFMMHTGLRYDDIMNMPFSVYLKLLKYKSDVAEREQKEINKTKR